MAYSFKKKENIGNKRTEYSRYYTGFRGVDFSSDHSQVNESRLAYLVNMYKDYQSGQGEALETIAGYRQRARFGDAEIYGIFYYKCKVDGKEVERVLVHCGTNLYLWDNYPYSTNITTTKSIKVSEDNTEFGNGIDTRDILDAPVPCVEIESIYHENNDVFIEDYQFDKETNKIYFPKGEFVKDQVIAITYYEGKNDTPIFDGMNERKSEAFVFNNLLYIIDGKNYLKYDGTTISNVLDEAYIPTTYISIIPAGDNADNGIEYEQRNILTPKFKHTFIGDGETTEFYMNENALDSVDKVTVYGNVLTEETDYTVDLQNGKITLTEAPLAPNKTERLTIAKNGENVAYERGYAGIEIVASKKYTSIDGVTQNMDNYSELITKCTLCTTFDGRVFFTGNSNYHNYLFYCGRNKTGYVDPTYFGVLNYMQDGVGLSPITGLMGVSNTLMVLKADTQQDSAIYFHSGMDTGEHLLPRIYPSEQGLSGLGCVGACRNFLDDPIFISKLGVEGVSQLKIASERVNEHRSKLIDAKLVNTDLSKAMLEEWGGYLCVLVDGNIYLADSRQRYADATGTMQYEWYYLEGIGVWDGQYKEYAFSNKMPTILDGIKIAHNGVEYELEIADAVPYLSMEEAFDLRGTSANKPNEEGAPSATINSSVISVPLTDDGAGTNIKVQVHYYVYEDEDSNGNVNTHIYLCDEKENFIGGQYKKATTLYTMSDNLFFGCENGVICSFNFDERDENGEIPSRSYHFDNRIILSGCATLMDNCQIPHLTKSTIKRSTVIKTRSFKNSTAKIKVRTNNKPYAQIARINSSTFSFDDLDFTDLSFETMAQSLFAIKEAEKQWVEKQYYIYSDEYCKPFSLYYISFRYRVAGRYKN